VVIPAGQLLWSDPVSLDFARDPERILLFGRKLAISFHVAGSSGPMTWHSKALQTNDITAPGAGSHSKDESDEAFPYTSTSWYFLDAVDTRGVRNAVTVVTLGDSITDGTGSTLNGDDRWPDDLARRLHEAYGNQVAVANAGIGGNRILTDAGAGGPPALSRLDRDVLGLSGVTAVIWFEGINDLSAGASAESVIEGIRTGVATLRARRPGLKIIQATITSSLGSTNGTPRVRRAPPGRQRLHPQCQYLRCGSRLRRRDGGSDHWPTAARVPAEQQHRSHRFSPSQPCGVSGDGPHDRSRPAGAAVRRAPTRELLKDPASGMAVTEAEYLTSGGTRRHFQPHRQRQDQLLDDHLPVSVDVQHRHAAVQAGYDQRADLPHDSCRCAS
jgi:lysophospholipase L1-like esterase